MFSSNQKLSISCDSKQLKDTISFALKLYKDGPVEHLVYQMTNDGRFVIGWFHKKPELGWTRFPFDSPSIDLLVEIVKQYVKAHPSVKSRIGDGSYHDGYLIEALPEYLGAEMDDIKNPFYAIISIRSFELFYHK